MMPLLRRHLLDFAELVLLPGIAALLPWTAAFRILRWCSVHMGFLYANAVNQAWCQFSRSELPAEDEASWKSRRRLVTLVDHADLYLARTRNCKRFLKRYVRVSGSWITPGAPAVLISLHWGAGMWGLYHARISGLNVVPLVESLDIGHFRGRPVLYRYAVARTRQVHSALGQPPVQTSSSLRPVLTSLDENRQVLSIADVPADRSASSIQVHFAGHNACVPGALFKLCASRRLPVCFYITGLDTHSGQRFLSIEPLGVPENAAALAEAVFSRLDQLVRQDSAAWHFWSEAERFFREAPPSSSSSCHGNATETG